MGKIAQRLIVFLVGVPAVVALVLLFPQLNHLALNLAIVFFSALGAVEFSNMLAQKNLRVSKAEAAVLGALLPAAVAAVAVVASLGEGAGIYGVFFRLLGYVMPAALTAGVLWLFLSRVFSSGEKLDGFAGRVVAGLAALLYPGVFMIWLVGMTELPDSGAVIITFLLMVFGGDSLAWATGMLFGKNNRGVVAASPSKSVAGFAGALLAPALVGIGAAVLAPGVFEPLFGAPVAAGAIMGLLTGAAAILGDLAESAFKRSAGVKDSGSVIIGRGGVLDSIDSVAVAAPVFYVCYSLLFGG